MRQATSVNAVGSATRRSAVRVGTSWGIIGKSESELCDLALYAHPEFAYPIVNLMCVGAPVAEDQAGSGRRFQVACAQGHCRNPLLGSPTANRHIVRAWG